MALPRGEMPSDHPGFAQDTLHSSQDMNLWFYPVSSEFSDSSCLLITQGAQAEAEAAPM